MPLEKTIVTAILRYLKSLDIWAMRLHGNPFQKPGMPDVLAIIQGHAVFFEVKRPVVGRVSEIQKIVMKELVDAGASVFVVTSVDEVIEALAKIKISRLDSRERQGAEQGFADALDVPRVDLDECRHVNRHRPPETSIVPGKEA